MSEFWRRRRQERALAAALAGREPHDRRAIVRAMVGNYVANFVVLTLTIFATPGINADDWYSIPLAALFFCAFAPIIQAVLARLASYLGWLGAGLLALFANTVVIAIVLTLAPGVHVGGFWETFLASWIYAVVMALFTWIFSVNSQSYLLAHAARMSMANAPAEKFEEPGVVFVQLDGVPSPVLHFHVLSGTVPTISRWLRDGTYRMHEWVARVPSTTPVSQAGILHGNNADIPAFRWYEKDTGSLVVANHPPDAALIESRISDGRGLLADDGVSISNLFSGDAQTSLLTMSGMKQRREGLGPSQSYAAFFTHPAGFMRALVLTVTEMLKELYQARQQRIRGIEPRIDRHGSYVLLRGVTNVLLRDLNTALVVESMMRGTKAIYVDYVDYDEIAHHAGVTRRESTDALLGLDRVVASLERIAKSGIPPRDYKIVIVSDHGQSQGATFRQRYGQTLEELTTELMDDPDSSSSLSEVEGWGRVNVLVSQLASQESVSGRLARRVTRKRDSSSALGPAAAEKQSMEADGGQRPSVVVIGSGNLGGIWLPRFAGRQKLDDLEREWPALVPGLAAHPGIGFVAVMTDDAPVAIGKHGSINLKSGDVTGADPLVSFGPHAREDMLRVCEFKNAPDIYLNSSFDTGTDEVAAFEELVGCHGGLGGWQTRPVIVHPADWAVDADLTEASGHIYGAENVYRQLVRWLEKLGHRKAL